MSDTEDAAVERVTALLEAEADRWLESWQEYPALVDGLARVGDLGTGVPERIRRRLKTRQRALIDRLVRAAYMEGFYNGGMSRRAHDEALRGQ